MTPKSACLCCRLDDVVLIDMLANQFTGDGKSVTFWDAYNEIFDIESTSKTNCEPCKICEKCSIQLINAFSFRKKCENSTDQFRMVKPEPGRCFCCLVLPDDPQKSVLKMCESSIESQPRSVPVFDAFVDCTEVIIAVEDAMKYQICGSCKFQLKNAYNFRKLCQSICRLAKKIADTNQKRAKEVCVIELSSDDDEDEKEVNIKPVKRAKFPATLQTRIRNRSARVKAKRTTLWSLKSKVAFKCLLCEGEIFLMSRKTIWDHVWVKHRYNMPHNCSFCQYKTQRKYMLRNHLRDMHCEEFDESVHGYHKESVQDIIDSAGRILQ